MSRTEHPGSTGGWASSFVEYDILGRVKRQSVPTETNSSYTPAGDDSAGPLWTHLKYDWMGRVVRKINTDGIDQTTLNDSDVLITYEGCGCAGGLVTTIQSEKVDAFDVAGNWQTGKRRVQKSYQDILGRAFKSEQWDLDGAGSDPYSTTVHSFNGRDQVVLSRLYDGSTSSSTYQDYTKIYDGHGRMWKTHRPEQQISGNPAYTERIYNPDDSPATIVDARGAASHYVYDSRGLVTQVSYSVPQGSGIEVTPTAAFTYDNVGNRTQMNDGYGSLVYEYDSLSRLTSETREFSRNLPYAPIANNKFKLAYTYNLGTKLDSYSDPFGQQFNLTYDKVGRLGSVTGAAAYVGITSYASNAQYRAWGVLKHLDLADSVSFDNTDFNSRLQATGYEAKFGTTTLLQKSFDFHADGTIKRSQEAVDDKFDRSYKYDFTGRIREAKASAVAIANQNISSLRAEVPYTQTFEYNRFGNLIGGSFYHYVEQALIDDVYVDNRNQTRG